MWKVQLTDLSLCNYEFRYYEILMGHFLKMITIYADYERRCTTGSIVSLQTLQYYHNILYKYYYGTQLPYTAKLCSIRELQSYILCFTTANFNTAYAD